ncbi:MAG: hypothetical protein WCY06_09615 [Flavobacteriaceae bacterium]
MEKLTTANKVLPKAGLNGFDWTFVQGSTFVLRLNFSAKTPPPSAIPKPLATSLKDNDIEKNNMTETKEYFCCNMKKEECQRSIGHICLPHHTSQRFASKRARFFANADVILTNLVA